MYTSTRCCVQPPKRRASCEDGDVLCPVWAQAGLCAGPTAEETVGLCQKSCNKCKRTDEPEALPSVRYDREGSPYVTDNRGQLVRASFSFGEAGQLIDSRGNVIPLPSSSTPDALERGQAAPPEAKAAAAVAQCGLAPLSFAEPVACAARSFRACLAHTHARTPAQPRVRTLSGPFQLLVRTHRRAMRLVAPL